MRIASPSSITPQRLDFNGSDRLIVEFQAKFVSKSRVESHSRFFLSDLGSIESETIKFIVDLRKSKGGTVTIKAKDIGFFGFKNDGVDAGAGASAPDSDHKFTLTQDALDNLRSVVSSSRTGIMTKIEEIVRHDLQSQAGHMKQKIDGVGSTTIYFEKMPHFVCIDSLFCFSNLSSYVYISKNLSDLITDPEIQAYFKPLEEGENFRQNSNFALLNKSMQAATGFIDYAPPQGLQYFSYLDLFERDLQSCADNFYKSNDLIDTVLLPAFKARLDELFDVLKVGNRELQLHRNFSQLFKATLNSITRDTTLRSAIDTHLERAIAYGQKINCEYRDLVKSHDNATQKIQQEFDNAKTLARNRYEHSVENLQAEIAQEKQGLTERQNRTISETDYINNALRRYIERKHSRLQRELDDLMLEYRENRTELRNKYQNARTELEYEEIISETSRQMNVIDEAVHKFQHSVILVENKLSQIMKIISKELGDPSFFEHFKKAAEENSIATALKLASGEGKFDLESFRTNSHTRNRILASDCYKEFRLLKRETTGLSCLIAERLRALKNKSDVRPVTKKLEELFMGLIFRSNFEGIGFKSYFRSKEESKKVASLLIEMTLSTKYRSTIEELIELVNRGIAEDSYKQIFKSRGNFEEIFSGLLANKLNQEKVHQLMSVNKTVGGDSLLEPANDLRDALFSFFVQNSEIVGYNHLEIAEFERILIYNSYVCTLHHMKVKNLLKECFFAGSTPSEEDIHKLQFSRTFKTMEALSFELNNICHFFINLVEFSSGKRENKSNLQASIQTFLKYNTRLPGLYIDYQHYPLDERSSFIWNVVSNSSILMQTSTFKILKKAINKFEIWKELMSAVSLHPATEDTTLEGELTLKINPALPDATNVAPAHIYTRLRIQYLEELLASEQEQNKAIYDEFYGEYLKLLEPLSCQLKEEGRDLIHRIDELNSENLRQDKALISQFKSEYHRMHEATIPKEELGEILDNKFTRDLEDLRKKFHEKLKHLDEIFERKFQEEDAKFSRNKSLSPKDVNYCPVNFRFYRTLEAFNDRGNDIYECEYNFVYRNRISQEKESYGQCTLQVLKNPHDIKTIRIIRPTTEFRKEGLSDLVTRTVEDRSMIEIKDPIYLKKILALLEKRDESFMRDLFGVMREYRRIVSEARPGLELGSIGINIRQRAL